MARDIFVYWPKLPDIVMPAKEAIAQVLEDYVRGLGSVEFHEGTGRFYATLLGRPSSAKKSVFPVHAHIEEGDTRWFEVFMHEDSINVIIRHADDVTSAIAEGFAQLCVHLWRGNRVEQ